MALIYRLALALLIACSAWGQTASLNGHVTDETGAVVPGATVTLSGEGGAARSAISAGDGSYSFSGVPTGSFTVMASAPGLAMAQAAKVSLRGGAQKLDSR